MNKALFIDRDGTINHDEGYTYRVKDLKIYDDIVPFIKKYIELGYMVIVISNQSGIGRKYFTSKDADAFNEALEKELAKKGVKISAFYYCPHKPEDNCNCRKPRTGLVEKASKDLNIDIKKSIVAGDKEDTDKELAKNLGINFMLVKH